MKKKKIVVIAMVASILSFSALSASAAGSCGKCADSQSVQQFREETAALSATLKAKGIELREQYAYDSFDIHKVGKLESELKELNDKINTVAAKYGIPACSQS